MGSPVKVTRDNHTAQELRRSASKIKDAGQALSVQAISLVTDDWSGREAASLNGMDRQTLSDWVSDITSVAGLATRMGTTQPVYFVYHRPRPHTDRDLRVPLVWPHTVRNFCNHSVYPARSKPAWRALSTSAPSAGAAAFGCKA